jgi:hypothetical protein
METGENYCEMEVLSSDYSSVDDKIDVESIKKSIKSIKVDNYAQEMNRLLKSLEIWDDVDLIENDGIIIDWNSKCRRFLTDNNIRPDFFCQYKTLLKSEVENKIDKDDRKRSKSSSSARLNSDHQRKRSKSVEINKSSMQLLRPNQQQQEKRTKSIEKRRLDNFNDHQNKGRTEFFHFRTIINWVFSGCSHKIAFSIVNVISIGNCLYIYNVFSSIGSVSS